MAELAGMDLGGNVVWMDEFDWSPVGQSCEVAGDGALVVEHTSTPRGGRPLTLHCGWQTRAVVRTLVALRDALPQTWMELRLDDGREFQVLFRHEAGALSAVPVQRLVVQEETDMYDVTLNLMGV